MRRKSQSSHLVFYTIRRFRIIVLSLLVPTDFLALAYDSGGAAAGALVLPVILSFGVGMSSVLSDRTDLSDVFGYIALATMGPILGVLLMGVLLF